MYMYNLQQGLLTTKFYILVLWYWKIFIMINFMLWNVFQCNNLKQYIYDVCVPPEPRKTRGKGTVLLPCSKQAWLTRYRGSRDFRGGAKETKNKNPNRQKECKARSREEETHRYTVYHALIKGQICAEMA